MKKWHKRCQMTAAVLVIVLMVILWHMFAPVPELDLQGIAAG